MFAFSIIWLVLAVAVIVVATARRSESVQQQASVRETSTRGNAVVFLAAIYGLALFAGFLYLSKFLVSAL